MRSLISKNFPAARMLPVVALWGGLVVPPAPAQDAAQPATVPPAAVQPTAVAAPLPAGILPGSPLSQVVRLAQAGVDEGIIQAYVTNSAGTFNLDSDKIIYLKDTGVPSDLVTEMMQHDTILQAQMAAAAPPSPTPDVPSAPPVPPATTADNSQPPPPDAQQMDAQPDDTAPPAAVSSIDDFNAALAPYGNWVIVDGYGSCWLPGVAIYNHDWQPYGDHGHWVYTDSGWYWTSDYTWGWAPFHYGRWFRSPRFGWCWQPDIAWAPSWVTWRYTDDYCGWAPLPPGAYYGDAGLVYDGTAVGDDYDFGLDADSFVFVSTVWFTDPHPFRHHLDRNFAGQVYHQSYVLNSYQHGSLGIVNRGIDPARITQATHTPVHTIPLRTETGVAGRYPANEPPRRTTETTSAYRSSSASYQNYRPAAGQNSESYRAPQPYNWQTQQRYNAPVQEQNRYYQPESVQRPYAPAEPDRPANTEPIMREEPPRMDIPAPEPRPEAPERIEAAPAPARPSAPAAAAPSRSSSSSDQKNGGH